MFIGIQKYQKAFSLRPPHSQSCLEVLLKHSSRIGVHVVVLNVANGLLIVCSEALWFCLCKAVCCAHSYLVFQIDGKLLRSPHLMASKVSAACLDTFDELKHCYQPRPSRQKDRVILVLIVGGSGLDMLLFVETGV